MPSIGIVEYLKNPITAFLDVHQLRDHCDHHERMKKGVDLYEFQFEECRLEACFSNGEYLYDMIRFRSQQFERRRLLDLDFAGMNENFSMSATEQFCIAHKLRYDFFDFYGERRMFVEARSISFVDQNSSDCHGLIAAIGGFRTKVDRGGCVPKYEQS